MYKAFLKLSFRYLQYIPLTLFLLYGRQGNFSETAVLLGFKYSFLWAIAMLILGFLFKQFNCLIYPYNIFLSLGGLTTIMSIPILQHFYSYFMACTGFIFILVFNFLRFIFLKQIPPFTLVLSLVFLILSVSASTFSFIFRANPMLGGTYPYVFLLCIEILFSGLSLRK